MTGENDTEENLTAPRVAVVTGASSGIGLAAAEVLARRGWAVAIVGRDPNRLREAETRVRTASAGRAPVHAFRCDFASLDAVRELASALRVAYPRIDVLANNAGGVVQQYESTVDGFEATIQTNYLAPFLLSHELRERLAGGRIVNTASRVHAQGDLRLSDLDPGRPRRRYGKLSTYARAKLGNVLFTAEAARRWSDILSTSFHPGIVRTRFGTQDPRYERFFKRMPGLRSPAVGAQTLTWLSTTDPVKVHSGRYYVDCRERRPARRAQDSGRAAELWEATAAALALR